MDECESSGINECDLNVMCMNIEGLYVCWCKKGYVGSGKNCIGKRSVWF